MKLLIAQRTRDCGNPDMDPNYVLNPEWINAPYELIQTDEKGTHSPVVGPFRFMEKDGMLAVECAKRKDWDGLKQLSVPELIPPLPK